MFSYSVMPITPTRYLNNFMHLWSFQHSPGIFRNASNIVKPENTKQVIQSLMIYFITESPLPYISEPGSICFIIIIRVSLAFKITPRPICVIWGAIVKTTYLFTFRLYDYTCLQLRPRVAYCLHLKILRSNYKLN